MESKKDIYHLWVQYTTQNEETYFRSFIKGFVLIWESQLNMKQYRTELAKPDMGPHLSRLPEELLPAIAKFIFIAKDQMETNKLTDKCLQETELLIKCLMVICRHFDNIPLVASCDYITFNVGIASSIVHNIVSDRESSSAEIGVSFILTFCELLECLYDPYFSWRHFLNFNHLNFEALTYQPALLHVEVVPFIHDCFQTKLAEYHPVVCTELLHVLGSIISGAQHNALRAVCPATVKIIIDIISQINLNDQIRYTALQCFIIMVKVLNRSTPDQRQIEIGTLIHLYKELLMDVVQSFIGSASLQSSKILCEMITVIRVLLKDNTSRSHIRQIFIDNHIIDTLIHVLQDSSKFEFNKQPLAEECVQTLTAIISDCNQLKDSVLKSGLFGKFITNLKNLGTPTRKTLEFLVEMVLEGPITDVKDSDYRINNSEALLALTKWVNKLDRENQYWLATVLGRICTANLWTKTVCCNDRVISMICEVLANDQEPVTSETTYVLINTLQVLASHSLTSYELKQMLLLLREDEDRRVYYRSYLINAISSIARKSEIVECNSYYDVQLETDGVSVPGIKKWPAAGYGFCFHCWLRLDTLEQTDNVRRLLFSLLTASGAGVEVFFRLDGTIVIGVTAKKEFLSACVSDHPLHDNNWHSVNVCYTAARRPFGHNQVSVFIDGVQRLSVSIKFPAVTDPFVYCTIGSVVQRVQQPAATSTTVADNKSSGKSLLSTAGLIPTFINQVPNYFTLPVRSSTPLDPHVKSFPAGMQDSVWGSPICLRGQIGMICLFQEALSFGQVKMLYESGPNCRSLFSVEETNELTELAQKLVFCYSPLACWNNLSLDLSPAGKFPGHVTAKQIHTFNIKEAINGVGGISVTLQIVENIASYRQTSNFIPSPSPEDTAEDMKEWEILPNNSYSDKKLQQSQLASYIILLKNLISNSKINQENLIKQDVVKILSLLLAKTDSGLMDVCFLMSIQLLVESIGDCDNTSPILRSIHQYLLFNFKIWYQCQFHIKIGHIQYISTLIKEDRKYFRKRFGVQFLLDVIRKHYSDGELLNYDDIKTIRSSLFALIKFYVQKETNIQEVDAILKFLFTVKEESLLKELFDMLSNHMDARSCRDQIFLLMYEPHAGELLYSMLVDRNLSMEVKQKVIRLLTILLRTERVYDKHKTRLRLEDGSVIGLTGGMYRGLVQMLNDQPLSVEFVSMLLDQMLLSENNNNYSGALALLNLLSSAEVEIKVEAARKILTTTFMKTDSPQMFAKQIGWQDSITKLLIQRPINIPVHESTEALPDLMSFDEEALTATEEEDLEDEEGYIESSISGLSNTAINAAHVIENKIEEVAGNVADNISSAVASAYSAFRQKTVEVQETIEDARIRLQKRKSLLSLYETSSEQDFSPTSSPKPDKRISFLSTAGKMDQSSSSTEDLSSPYLEEDKDAKQTEAKIMGEVLSEWCGDKEEELCYLVSNILFTILWRGVEGSSRESWIERGQVMACINMLALNNQLYTSHLQLKLKIIEMGVQASLSDLRDSTQPMSQHTENAAQLMKWVYDLVVLDPNEEIHKRTSVRLLDNVLGLVDTLLVFQEHPGEEWADMVKLTFGILLTCCSCDNLELCAMSTAKLHALIQTRRITDASEGGYLLYSVNKAILSSLNLKNQEKYCFLMPVMKGLLEKMTQLLSLPQIPHFSSGPSFFDHFKTYCISEEWTNYVDKKIRPLHDSYKSNLATQLTESMNVFWAECYESSKHAVAKRNRESADSKSRFQSQILTPFRTKLAEEKVRLNNLMVQERNQRLLVRRKWKNMKQFFVGQRGAWQGRSPVEQYWKLSHHENLSRMRLKLQPNLNFDQHVEASNLRDNTGWLSRVQSADEMNLPLGLPLNIKSESEDALRDEDLKTVMEPETEGVEHGKEKLVISQECELVTLMTIVKGRLDVTTSRILFHDMSPVKEDIERQDFQWPLSKLREMHLRRYNLRRSALELFLIDQTNYFLNFTKKTRNQVFSRILTLRPANLYYYTSRSPGDVLKASGLTQKWISREITNFEYLMHLNTIAGRTYNDLSQYPVFPWILADYTSDILDLNDKATFRDLSKPIGVVNRKNEIEVCAKYESFEDPSGTIAKFHYGTHYSNSAGVLHYLVRVEPFTSLHIELQSGRFDVADRQFHSIPQTWKLLMDNPNDVKELTPEFFYFPEFLKNLNKFDLGLLQGTKERVDDVILPKWAESPEDFIYKHRKALESEHVSLNLHHWIDLIFGFKQKGPKAVEALNVFYYCSYEGAVDLDAIQNPVEREAVEGMINNFGQTPCQLLKEPHPQRLSWEEAVSKMLKSEIKKPDVTLFLDNMKPFTIEITNDKDPLVYLSVPRSTPKAGFILAGLSDTIVSVSKSGVVCSHSWLPFDKHSYKGFQFDVDPAANSTIKARKKISGSFHPSVPLSSQLFVLSIDGKLLFTVGHWDSSLRVFSLVKGKTMCSVIKHFDLVTCLALDLCGSYLITGSRDTTCVIWDVSHLGVPNVPVSSAPPKPVHILCGHDKQVSSVAIMTELDMAVSASLDGTVNIHTVQSGQYIRTLLPLDSCTGSEVTHLTLSSHGHIAFAAKNQSIHSVHVYSINGVSLGSKYVSGQVTGLTVAGDSLVVVDDAGDLTISRLLGLHPIYDIPLHVPVQCVVVTSGSTHILVPLRDGTMVVIGVPNTC